MILYEVTNGAGKVLAYFLEEHLARNYCQHNKYLKYEKICILYDAIDVFREHKLIESLEEEFIPCIECIHSTCDYEKKKWGCTQIPYWKYETLKEMHKKCPKNRRKNIWM